MNILGISCFYHDASACLLQDGRVVAAAEEERFTRKKHDFNFPINAVRYCLQAGGITPGELNYIGFYEKPFIKFERLLFTYLDTFPRSFNSFRQAIPLWLNQKLWIAEVIRKGLKTLDRDFDYEGEVFFIEHHLSHAASSYFISGFNEASVLTMDAIGEWATSTLSRAKDNDIEILYEMHFPHSLGMLYSAFTYYLGFEVNDGEYKVMGLAPYGKPVYYDIIMKNLLDLKEDGSFRMDMRYFGYDYGLRMITPRFCKLFGGPPRVPEAPFTKKDFDLAASIQKVSEEMVMRMVRYLYKIAPSPNLCLAGGVALNCVANGRILREGQFKNIFIQPAAGDGGGSVGVATYTYHNILKQPRSNDVWQNAFLGPGFSDEEIKGYLVKNNIPFKEFSYQELLKTAARLIDQQKVIGWFQGRMEFGPRALGGRSILADARNPKNKDIVNEKVKKRESFRPFAPTVLEEFNEEYFEIDRPSPYMLLVADVRPDKRIIPSVTHVDGSARIQSIQREDNPIYYDLIREFYKLTGVPVIINTSFNIRGEPIVCTPEDAYRCFIRTGLDYLVMGSCLLGKEVK